MLTVFELARKYYPLLWNKSRIDTLYQSGKLTETEYEELLNSNESSCS